MKGGSLASTNVMSNAKNGGLNYYPCGKHSICNPVGGKKSKTRSNKNKSGTKRKLNNKNKSKKLIKTTKLANKLKQSGGDDPGLAYFGARTTGDSVPGGTFPVPNWFEGAQNVTQGETTILTKSPSNITANPVVDAMSVSPILNYNPFSAVYPN
tara:strand:- start:54 stop:515 length:462 start_codon:yes stop_codon:yes gene_type:complete